MCLEAGRASLPRMSTLDSSGYPSSLKAVDEDYLNSLDLSTKSVCARLKQVHFLDSLS